MATKLVSNHDAHHFHGHKINHKLKLIYIESYKCASTSMAKMLLETDSNWEKINYPQLITWEDYHNSRYKLNFPDYKTFGIIRHPIDWCVSGYTMFRLRHGMPKTFMQHCTLINNSFRIFKDTSIDWPQWYKHCALLPDSDFFPDTLVFKLEELPKFKLWYHQNAVDVLDYKFPIVNERDEQKFQDIKDEIDLGDKRIQELLKQKFIYYCMKHNYKLDYKEAQERINARKFSQP